MTAIAIARYADEGPYLRARLRAITADRRIIGEWMPYASDALGEGMGGGGILASVVIGGAIGSIGMFALESWSAVLAYPFHSGGRALWAWQTFLPAPVEFAALAGAVVGMIWFFRNAGLTRLNHPAFDFDEVARAAQDSFVLALACDAGADSNIALDLLAEGAAHTQLVEG